MTRNLLKNDTFPLLKSKFSTSKHICQTYAKMIFELCVIRCTKANMAKHGEYALFLPLKFEKNEKNCKIKPLRDIEPHPAGWKEGMHTTRPQELIQYLNMIGFVYVFSKWKYVA